MAKGTFYFDKGEHSLRKGIDPFGMVINPVSGEGHFTRRVKKDMTRWGGAPINWGERVTINRGNAR